MACEQQDEVTIVAAQILYQECGVPSTARPAAMRR